MSTTMMWKWRFSRLSPLSHAVKLDGEIIFGSVHFAHIIWNITKEKQPLQPPDANSHFAFCNSHFATVKASIRWHIVISLVVDVAILMPPSSSSSPSPPPQPPLLLNAINCQCNKLMNTSLRVKVLLFEWHIIRFDHCCVWAYFLIFCVLTV